MYRFRDPIHGYIEVSTKELAIIDTPSFQRLRRIKQLATTYLVYPGAEHTRFGHSLGVMHLASRSFDTIIKKNPNLFSEEKAQWYRQILRLIGLIHDLGHAPFSHASEVLFEKGLEHEDYTKKVIFETEVAAGIRAIGQELVQAYGEDYDITPELVWMVYEGKDILNEKYILPDFSFLKSFLDSELDCDKMDYLLRDSYYCGVQYGSYDLDRLVDSFTVYKKPEENILLLAIDQGGVHAVEEFILARYFMFLQVYFHKTRRVLDKRLIDCLKEILPSGKYPVDIVEYLQWDDVRVLSEIMVQEKESAQGFLLRSTMPCVYATNAHLGYEGRQRLRDMECAIEEGLLAFGLDERNIEKHFWCDDGAQKTVHSISAELDDEKSIPVLVNYQEKPVSILDESLLLRSLTDPIFVGRLYVSKPHEMQAKTIIANYNE
ncbi:MAG: HD domain-containing protein [Raoultibacter sp.]